MAETNVTIGYDTSYEISTDGGSTWASVDEITNITPPPFTVDQVDATHMKSPNRTEESIPGIKRNGEAGMTLNWIPGSDSDVLINSLTNGSRFKSRITYPNGVTSTYSGYLAGAAPAVPLDDKMSTDITIKVSSVLVSGAAAAPANSVLPAISGTLAEGDVLTAYPGVWTGVPTFSYVWKNAGVAIGGATESTYIIQASDSGDAITVTVTGTNSAGTASATSAPVTAD